MPSLEHDAPLLLFQDEPRLAATLVQDAFGLRLPEYTSVVLGSAEVTSVVPTEFRADAVTVLRDGDVDMLAIIVEVQRRPDPVKRRSWPVYLATLHARLRCPVVLLVYCADTSTARWCGEPIDLGHGRFTLRPLVAGPASVPAITDPDEAAADPALAILSALTHPAKPVVEAMAHGLNKIEPEKAAEYTHAILGLLPAAARAHLETIMRNRLNFTYSSPFTDELRAEGAAQEGSRAVLVVLAKRGVAVTDEVTQRVRACTDLDLLHAWLERALEVGTAEELFA